MTQTLKDVMTINVFKNTSDVEKSFRLLYENMTKWQKIYFLDTKDEKKKFSLTFDENAINYF